MKTMDSVSGAERECTLLGTLFQYIITDLKVRVSIPKSQYFQIRNVSFHNFCVEKYISLEILTLIQPKLKSLRVLYNYSKPYFLFLKANSACVYEYSFLMPHCSLK